MLYVLKWLLAVFLGGLAAALILFPEAFPLLVSTIEKLIKLAQSALKN